MTHHTEADSLPVEAQQRQPLGDQCRGGILSLKLFGEHTLGLDAGVL